MGKACFRVFGGESPIVLWQAELTREQLRKVTEYIELLKRQGERENAS